VNAPRIYYKLNNNNNNNKQYFKLSYLDVNAGQMEMTKTVRSQRLPLINGRLSG
jgi:hypothetical protein